MSDFKRQHHNPIELIKRFWPDADISHIEYDPDMKPSERQYWRVEGCGHDSTQAFTLEMLQKCLIPLVNMETYYKQDEPKSWGLVKRIHYKIGPIRHAIVYGRVNLGSGNYPGIRERVRIPVVCEYEYSKEAMIN